MPECPRCRHPAAEAPTVCTQCGCRVPAGADGGAGVSLPKVLLLALAGAMLLVLLWLAWEYAGAVGQLAK